MLANLLERLYFRFGKNWVVFFVLSGILYSLLGVLIGLSTGIPMLAVFIISLALIPTIKKFIALAELLEGKTTRLSSEDKSFSMIELKSDRRKTSIQGMFQDYSNVVSAYTTYFLTILLVFAFLAFFIHNAVEIFFSLSLTRAETVGNLFFSILRNNLSVFSIAFLFSLILEFGATFVISFNAALWGTTLGSLLRQAYLTKETAAGLAFIWFFPHLILEAMAYFLAAIAGAILSKALISEKLESSKFSRITIQAIILLAFGLLSLILGAYVESIVIPATGY